MSAGDDRRELDEISNLVLEECTPALQIDNGRITLAQGFLAFAFWGLWPFYHVCNINIDRFLPERY